MKFLSNFHPGRIAQERMILERLLKSSSEVFDAHWVHSVLSVLHESVYLVIHDHVRIKKAKLKVQELIRQGQSCMKSQKTPFIDIVELRFTA